MAPVKYSVFPNRYGAKATRNSPVSMACTSKAVVSGCGPERAPPLAERSRHLVAGVALRDVIQDDFCFRIAGLLEQHGGIGAVVVGRLRLVDEQGIGCGCLFRSLMSAWDSASLR